MSVSQKPDAVAPPAERLLALPRVLVIAHRGYSELAPENTAPAFELAQKAGADLVELDYHRTKDQEHVVIHDATLDRTTDAVEKWGREKISVGSKSLEELRELDAGKWFGPSFAGTKLLTLAEALEVIQKRGVTLIEHKSGDAASCAALVRLHGWVNHVVVQSFDWNYLTDYHRIEPGQILASLGPPGSKGGKKLAAAEKMLNAAWIDEALQTGARVIGWNSQVTKEAVVYAHEKGAKVWIYTINEAEKANPLLDMGVDGIITNNPSIIWRTLALRGTK